MKNLLLIASSTTLINLVLSLTGGSTATPAKSSSVKPVMIQNIRNLTRNQGQVAQYSILAQKPLGEANKLSQEGEQLLRQGEC